MQLLSISNSYKSSNYHWQHHIPGSAGLNDDSKNERRWVQNVKTMLIFLACRLIPEEYNFNGQSRWSFIFCRNSPDNLTSPGKGGENGGGGCPVACNCSLWIKLAVYLLGGSKHYRTWLALCSTMKHKEMWEAIWNYFGRGKIFLKESFGDWRDMKYH